MTEYHKPSVTNNDIIHFVWQLLKYPHWRQYRRQICKDKHLWEEWICPDIWNWNKKYHIAELYEIIRTGFWFLLIDEMILSIQYIDQDSWKLSEIFEIKLNLEFVNTFHNYSGIKDFPIEHRDDMETLKTILEVWKIWTNWIIWEMIFKLNTSNCNQFINDYIVMWDQEQLIKPRNYLLKNYQLSLFCRSLYENYEKHWTAIQYQLWTSSQIDEFTLLLYLEYKWYIKIEYFRSGSDLNYFVEKINTERVDINIINVAGIKCLPFNIEKNKLIIELWDNYFISYEGTRVNLRWRWFEIIKKIYNSNTETIELSQSLCKSPSKVAFDKMLTRFRNDIKPWNLYLEKLKINSDVYALKKIENK